MVESGNALGVPGNHDMKLMRALRGKDVQITHGLAESLAEVAAVPTEAAARRSRRLARSSWTGLSAITCSTAASSSSRTPGMKQEMQGRGSGKVRDFALYGETTGETDEFGLPVRYNWAAEYRGPAMVVYGHTPVPEPEWLNRTINIDTGCVFGGKLTALRYPERELVSVPAAQTYCEPAKPFLATMEAQAPRLTAQQTQDDLLDAEDVIGKRIIMTRLRGNVTIREENATAALEVMSRFADRSQVAHLPAADDVALRNRQPGSGFSKHPARGFCLLPLGGRPHGGVRREAHGIAGRGHHLP